MPIAGSKPVKISFAGSRPGFGVVYGWKYLESISSTPFSHMDLLNDILNLEMSPNAEGWGPGTASSVAGYEDIPFAHFDKAYFSFFFSLSFSH